MGNLKARDTVFVELKGLDLYAKNYLNSKELR